MRYWSLSLLIFTLLFSEPVAAQDVPKWFSKAQKAVFSVITYDGEGNLLNSGNGFFVSEEGVAFSSYRLFEGAEKAVVITQDGKQLAVNEILGADDMYDVVKFRVEPPKKITYLSLSEKAAEEGQTVFLLPYSTQKSKKCTRGTVKKEMKINDSYRYYTLSLPLKSKMANCPLMDEEGKVLAIAQPSTGSDTVSISYGMDVNFIRDLNINALSSNDPVLNKIGIRKGLPQTEDDALVYLYMIRAQIPVAEYISLLDEFIRLYPNSTEGYIRRAAAYACMENPSEEQTKHAQEDLEEAVKIALKKSDVYYSIARMMYNLLADTPDKTKVLWGFDEALSYTDKAISEEALPIYVQLKGDILFAKQDYKGAADCYAQVNKSELVGPATFYSTAKALQMAGEEPEVVIAMMDSCVARCNEPLTPATVPYVLERAEMNMQAGHYRKAWLDYNTYYEVMGGKVNDVFYYLRGQAASKSKQYQVAIDDLTKAMSLNPSEIAYPTELAGINLIVGRPEIALELLDKVISSTPQYAEAYRLKGLCLIRLKKNSEACACFEQAKKLGDPLVDELIKKYCK